EIVGAGVILDQATCEGAPHGCAVIATCWSFSRCSHLAIGKTKTGVVPRCHEPRAAEVGAVDRHQHAPAPHMKGIRKVKLHNTVKESGIARYFWIVVRDKVGGEVD